MNKNLEAKYSKIIVHQDSFDKEMDKAGLRTFHTLAGECIGNSIYLYSVNNNSICKIDKITGNIEVEYGDHKNPQLNDCFNCKRNLTIHRRLGIETHRHWFVRWFMNQEGVVDGYKNVIWSGVTTLQLAKAIEADIAKQETGLYHLVNNQTINKHDLLSLFNRVCRNRQVEIRENRSVVSDRSILNTQKEPAFPVPGYEQMVCEMADWMKKHRKLYQQYEEAMRWTS